MGGVETLVITDNNSDRLVYLVLIIAAAIIIGNLINMVIRYKRGKQLKAVIHKIKKRHEQLQVEYGKREVAENAKRHHNRADG